jgi:regulator of protease activity HflC (stomatin/prohibitin superfamily)
MREKQVKIDCAVFQKRETAIEDITAKINRAEGVEEKAVFAPELQKEVDVLLSCSDYDENSLDCKNCHFIATLRSKAAKLIIKAKKLAE